MKAPPRSRFLRPLLWRFESEGRVEEMEAEVASSFVQRSFIPEGKARLTKPAVAPDQPPLPRRAPGVQLDVLLCTESIGRLRTGGSTAPAAVGESLDPVGREERC